MTIQVTSDLKYGSDPMQALDVYQPPGSKLPMVVLVHGGSWIHGDKSAVILQATDLANAGYLVFALSYRLATANVVGYPMEVNDVTLAAKWAKANALVYGGDPSRCSYVGGSAGAHLVALATEQLNTSQKSSKYIKATVTLSAPLDLQSLVRGAIAAGADQTTDASIGLSEFLGHPFAQCSNNLLKSASPQFHVDTYTPPYYLFHSANEFIPIAQAQNFVKMMNSKGRKVQLTVVPGHLHAMSYWSLVVPQIITYLKTHV